MRKLASIQTIAALSPITGADRIELATVLGWQTVVRKGSFAVGERCIFVEVDAVFPDVIDLEFPKQRRVKTMMILGQLSQGFVMKDRFPDEPVGADVTDWMGITKWEPPPPKIQAGEQAGPFPEGIPKTDETRIQVLEGTPWLGRELVATLKYDGTSATYYNGLCCSRNNVRREGLYTELQPQGLPEGVAVQGEICGPGVQANRLGLSARQLFVFNVFERGRYYNDDELRAFCAQYGLTPVEQVPLTSIPQTIGEWVEAARGQYPSGYPREGIVVRAQDVGPRLSFKVINPDFLLKSGE